MKDLKKLVVGGQEYNIRDDRVDNFNGSSGGGVSSWNDLTDKPFYEYEEEYSETITGMTTIYFRNDGNRVTVETPLGLFIHINDAVVPTVESAIGGTLDINYIEEVNGSTSYRYFDLTEDQITTEGNCIFLAESVISVSEENSTAMGCTFPKKGLYFLYDTDNNIYINAYIGVLTVTNTATRTVVKKIDDKFLPEPLIYDNSETVTEEMTIEWDGIVGDKEDVAIIIDGSIPPGCHMVRISDAVFPLDGPTGNYTMIMKMGEEEMPMLDNVNASDFFYYKDDCFTAIAEYLAISVMEDNSTFPEIKVGNGSNRTHVLSNLTFPKKGLYVLQAPGMGYIGRVIGIFTTINTEIKKLDPKFLPDTIESKELILTSSTEGSIKKFKITVTDDGTLTATEVV